MATLSTILSFSRVQSGTDSNGLTDATGIIFANEALQDFHRRLVQHGVDASQLQETYTSGVAGQGTYLYPTNMLALKAIELNYTDTSAQNYRTAQQCDVANIPGNQSFSWLRTYCDPNAPQFDDRGDWYEIFPTPSTSQNVTNMIKMFYYLQPTQYTATSDTVSYPESLDVTILGWRIAASYLYSLGSARIPDGDKFMANYENRVTQYISTLGRGSQQPLEAKAVQISGWQF